MNRYTVYVDTNKDCLVKFRDQAILRTSVPLEYEGTGTFPSSTDLLSISLATCIATSLANQNKNSTQLRDFHIKVSRSLSCYPKKLKSIGLVIFLRDVPSKETLEFLKMAIRNSPVKKALSRQLTIVLDVRTVDGKFTLSLENQVL